MLIIEFVKNNLGTISVLLAVVLIMALLAVKLVRDKRSGKSGCSCGCSSCAFSGSCHGGKKN